jgi:hypothetical protein
MSYQGKKWTDEELSTLLDLIKKGKDYKFISTKITRSEFAVKCKFESYIFDKISNKKATKKELARELKLTEEEIEDAYQSQFKRNMTQNGGTTKNNTVNGWVNNQVNPGTNILQLGSVNSYSIINRILTPYIEYHENLKKLEEIKDVIDKKTMKKIKEILNGIEFDSDKFITQLKKTSETLKIQPEPIKSNSTTDESDVESKQSTKKSDDEDDEDDEDKDDKYDDKPKESLDSFMPLKKRLF